MGCQLYLSAGKGGDYTQPTMSFLKIQHCHKPIILSSAEFSVHMPGSCGRREENIENRFGQSESEQRTEDKKCLDNSVGSMQQN